MGVLGKTEKQLDKWLRQKAPFQLPPESRKGLATSLWWVALLVGLVQLWGAWLLWHAGHLLDATSKQYTHEVYSVSGAGVTHLGLFYWLSLAAIAAVAVLMLIASPKLKLMKKSGWNMLFYAMLLNMLFALMRLLSGVDGVFSGFVGAIVGTFVGTYLLFQVRNQFSGKHTARAAAKPEHDDQSHDDKSDDS